MPDFFFADNTVLVNFALLDRLDLLEALLNARGRWCLTVSHECRRSAREPGLEKLTSVPGFLGEPVAAESRAERVLTQVLRDKLVSPLDGPHKSLGEAETLAIMNTRFRGDFFISDDKGAARLAADRGLDLGVRVVTTRQLLDLAASVGKLTPQEHHEYLTRLRRLRRHV